MVRVLVGPAAEAAALHLLAVDDHDHVDASLVVVIVRSTRRLRSAVQSVARVLPRAAALAREAGEELHERVEGRWARVLGLVGPWVRRDPALGRGTGQVKDRPGTLTTVGAAQE